MKSKADILRYQANFRASGAFRKLSRYVACALLALPLAVSAAVYVATGPGSFYDKPIQFKDHPSDTDYVCASVRAPGPYIAPGRPCDFVLWPDIPATLSIATCNTSGGICHNNNGGIETYVVKASISGSTPTPPVVTPPVGGPGQFTVTWPPVLKGTLGEDVSKDITGYCIYYGLTVGSMATKYCVGNVLTATVTNLPAGFYYLQMTAVAGKEESEKTSAGSVNVTGTPATPPIHVPVAVISTPGTWSAKKSSTNIKTGLATHNDCMAYLVTQPAGKYSCAFSGETVTVK